MYSQNHNYQISGDQNRLRKYAIVVDVREELETCFIAMPFAKEEELEKIHRLIVSAANELSLKPIRTDLESHDPDFVKDFFNGIRSAKMVVAVLIPEDGYEKANPNVMYELGLAHALGKPTVILVKDIHLHHVPGDVYSKNAVEFKPNWEDRANITQIKDKMNEILNRMKNEASILIDPSWRSEGISVATAKYTMCLHHDFWGSLQIVFSFTESIHNHMLPISIEVRKLLSEVERVTEYYASKPYTEGELEKMKPFKQALKEYENRYEMMKDEMRDQLEEKFKEVNAAFNCIQSQNDCDAQEYINESKEIYRLIEADIREYMNRHNQVFNQGDPSNDLRNPVKAQILGMQLEGLLLLTRVLSTRSQTLMKSLVVELLN